MPARTLEQKLSHTLEANPSDIYLQAVDVLKGVHATLQMRKDARIDEFRTTGSANCLGYTLLGSEQLDTAGLPHDIGFVNGHATTLLYDQETTWLFDLYAPDLHQPLAGKYFPFAESNPDRQIGSLDRITVALQSNNPNDPYEAIIGKRTWLRSPMDPEKLSDNLPQRHYRDRSLIMSTFSAQPGREVIRDFGHFRDAVKLRHRKDTSEAVKQRCNREAAEAIIRLDQQMPERDMRTDTPEDFAKVVKQLAITGDAELAAESTEAFFSGLNLMRDGRAIEYKADCLRYIAKHSGQRTLARAALLLYKQSQQLSRRHQRSLVHKLELCQELA